MKYFYTGLIALCIAVFCFCSSEKETVKDVVKTTYVPKCLTEENMFIWDSVQKVWDSCTALQKAESRQYFLKALDLLVNKKNAQGSIEFFKESIMYGPVYKSYFYLANAYIEIGDDIHAEKANSIILGYGDDVPYYEAQYQGAVIYGMRKDTANCLDALNQAIAEGFLNKDRILKEKHFDFMRNEPEYIAMMVNTFNDDEKLKGLVFKNFLKLFPDLSLPYSEPLDSVAKYNYDKYINYDYAVFIPGMEDGRFSRDVTNEYLYVGKMKLDNSHHAVIYKTVLAIADTLNPVKTYVQTYDSLGNIIDSEMIGCFCSPTESQVFTINTDYSIQTTPYMMTWQNDPVEKGYAGNSITSTETGKNILIHVEHTGTISREGVASATSKTGG